MTEGSGLKAPWAGWGLSRLAEIAWRILNAAFQTSGLRLKQSTHKHLACLDVSWNCVTHVQISGAPSSSATASSSKVVSIRAFKINRNAPFRGRFNNENGNGPSYLDLLAVWRSSRLELRYSVQTDRKPFCSISDTEP